MAGCRACEVQPVFHQAMGVVDGGRHQYIGFVGCVAEHQALVTRTLLKVGTFAFVNTHGDIV